VLGSGDGQFGDPQGVAVDGSGSVFAVDANDRVQKFDNSGTFLTTWGTTGTGNGQFNDPTGVAVDGSGHVFVADTNNHRIQKFDNTGTTFLTMWGMPGTGTGQFDDVQGVAVAGTGTSSPPM
jgi:tripartite motif-containing protein 71